MCIIGVPDVNTGVVGECVTDGAGSATVSILLAACSAGVLALNTGVESVEEKAWITGETSGGSCRGTGCALAGCCADEAVR